MRGLRRASGGAGERILQQWMPRETGIILLDRVLEGQRIEPTPEEPGLTPAVAVRP